MDWLIFVIVWIVCGVINYGLVLPYWKYSWPDVYNVQRDKKEVLKISFLGPIALF